MHLSDKTIKERLKTGQLIIDPYDPKNLQPASYDLHLGNEILRFDQQKSTLIDVKKPVKDMMKKITLDKDEPYIIASGAFILANVKEVTGVDKKHIGRLEGKSSLARLGLIIHATAGFLDPNNSLRMTLEIFNLSPLPIKIYEGMKIAQMAFAELDQECETGYGEGALDSKYMGNMTVEASMMHKNFKGK